MCGFLQVFQKGQPVNQERFKECLTLIKHRGPDYTGTTFQSMPLTSPEGDFELYVASGHQRLSILDLDQRSAQPFRRDKQTLLFNGEIYNFRTLRSDAPLNGLHYDTTGDTEVLFRGLQHEGASFLEKLNGMWALTFLDLQKATLLTSRDRYGKKPLFYYIDDEHICFSSTIKPIQQYLGIDLSIRSAEMDAYLQHGIMFPAATEDTHFMGIKQVLPGHALQLDLSAWSIKTSFAYDPLEQDDLRNSTDLDELSLLVRDAVAARLTSDRQVGLLLSGGIDSTLVLSAMCAAGMQDQVRCFIGETGKSPDAVYAKQCVDKLGISATTIHLRYDDATFDRFLNMCRHHEKAFPLSGNAMAMSEMYEWIGREDVPVVLDGTGGDELFGGYWVRGFPSAVREALKNGDFKWLAQTAASGKEDASRVFVALRDMALRNGAWTINVKQARRRRSPHFRILGLDRHKVASPDPLDVPDSDFTRAALLDIAPGGRLGEWIWHNDRNAMMSGIENRSPLLDHRLRPFIGTGYRSKIHKGWNKYELRQVFGKLVELPTQWRRQKQGFRWVGKNFLCQNKGAILDLISQSECLKNRYDVAAYVDRAHINDKFFRKNITSRLLCIAGLEETLGITPPR